MIDSLKFISSELDNNIEREFQIRNSLDTKILSALGVIVALLTLLITSITVPELKVENCIYEIIVKYTLFSAGFILIIISVINLFKAVLPKKYYKLDLEPIIQLDISSIELEDLVQVCNERKSEILCEYHNTNECKSKSFRRGIMFGIFGLATIAVVNIFLLKLI